MPETGFAKVSMRDGLEHGYCAEDAFPSNEWNKVQRATSAQTESTQLVQIEVALNDLKSLQDNMNKGFFKSASDLPYFFKFKNINREKFFSILSRFPSSDMGNDFLDAIRVAACDGNRKPYPGRIDHITMRVKGAHTFKRFGKMFAQNTPVSVDFFYGVLENLDHYKVSLSELHTTILLGRRFDPVTHECQYLMKNSYGPNCDNEDRTRRYDSRIACDQGYLWVPEGALYGAMTSYVYIKDVLADDTDGNFRSAEEVMVESSSADVAQDDEGQNSEE